MLFAQATRPPEVFWTWVLDSLAFGLLGIFLLVIGYFAFDVLTRRIDVQEQLNRGNLAVAIVVAALLLSIAYLVTHVVH
jgi:putative membrane protein